MGDAGQNKTAIVAITKKGTESGRLLHKALRGSVLYLPEKLRESQSSESIIFQCPLKELLERIFHEYPRLVLFMAVGAAIRLLSPLIKSKEKDPAVVIVDQEGKFAISLLSGHLGGANELARKVASALKGIPVITTASDSGGTLAADMIGREFGWEVENKENIKFVSAALVNGEKVAVYQDRGEGGWLPQDKKSSNLVFYDSLQEVRVSDCRAAILITDSLMDEEGKPVLRKSLIFRPKSLVVGVGCRRGTSGEEIEHAIVKATEGKKLSLKSVRNLATIDIKKGEEGISLVAGKYGWPVEYFSHEELNQVRIANPSPHVYRRTGAAGVCEPAALISSGSMELLMEKKIIGNVTIALARVPLDAKKKKEGKLYLVGLGPGNLEQMTERARKALEDSEIIVGYRSYLDQIDGLLAGKEVISSGMGDEVPRSRQAIALARDGRRVSLVSGGDAGIYGMAGLLFELLQKDKVGAGSGFDCEVVPGVPALNAAASLLGAPLMCDFAAVNLSDLLVPWENIAERLERAAQGDFVIVLYNPASKKRKNQIVKAREILLKYRDSSTPVGIVSNAYREGQSVVLTDLEHMLDHPVGMNTLVIAGNSTTFRFKGWMVTPRGYGSKYKLEENRGKKQETRRKKTE